MLDEDLDNIDPPRSSPLYQLKKEHEREKRVEEPPDILWDSVR